MFMTQSSPLTLLFSFFLWDTSFHVDFTTPSLFEFPYCPSGMKTPELFPSTSQPGANRHYRFAFPYPSKPTSSGPVTVSHPRGPKGGEKKWKEIKTYFWPALHSLAHSHWYTSTIESAPFNSLWYISLQIDCTSPFLLLIFSSSIFKRYETAWAVPFLKSMIVLTDKIGMCFATHQPSQRGQFPSALHF